MLWAGQRRLFSHLWSKGRNLLSPQELHSESGRCLYWGDEPSPRVLRGAVFARRQLRLSFNATEGVKVACED